jgi:hypothetical protein
MTARDTLPQDRLPGQDSQERTAKAEKPGQNSQKRTAKTGPAKTIFKIGRQSKTVKT